VIRVVVTLKGHPVGRFDLDAAEVKIGRNPDNDVQIDNRSVSRYHCRLVREAADGWRAEDLGSHNGTTLNGAPLRQPSPVRTGDSVGVGHFDVAVRIDDPSAAPGAAALVAVRPTGAPEEREQAAPEKGYLVPVGAPGAPTPLNRDLFQIGAAPGADLRVAGPPKVALIVRGYGGFQLVHTGAPGARLLVDGQPVTDRLWLRDGVRIQVGGLELDFRHGLPAASGEQTAELTLPPNLAPPPGWVG